MHFYLPFIMYVSNKLKLFVHAERLHIVFRERLPPYPRQLLEEWMYIVLGVEESDLWKLPGELA